MERNNINVRAQFWQSLINHCTSTVCNRIFNITSSTQRTKFEYKIPENINNSLMQYLLEWKGLNTKLIDLRKKPKNFNEYELKAKNWLNGRRAKEYSIGLYVDMIICAEKYANDLQKTLFNNLDNKNYRQSCKDLFYDILMYSYLTEMCNKQCHINERKVWLLCSNSMKAHKQNETLRIFQLYAKDHDYIDQFPRHRNEAIDYFKAKMDNARDSLLILFQEIETQKIPHEPSEKLLEIIYFISSKCQTPNGKNVIINTRTFAMIESAIKQLKDNVKRQKNEIKVLNDKHTDLINNNHINPIKTEREQQEQEQDQQQQYLNPYYNSYPPPPFPFASPSLSSPNSNLQYQHPIIASNINNINNIRKRNMDDAAMENISFESLPNKRQKIIDNDCNMDNNTNNDWDTMSLNGCNNWPIFHYNYNPNTGLYQPLDGQSVYDNDLNSTTANTTALNTLF